MRSLKLWTHKQDYSDEELMLNPNSFPELRVGDVVEIYHPEDDFSRLLLQVQEGSLCEEFQQKDVVSMASSIAQEFRLRMYKEVNVNVVDPKAVALDMVELAYKEQYFSRADMWRLRQYLVNTCLYLNKKSKFAEMRVQVYDMWSKGDKVACGVVTDDTRITFRSYTSQINIFIQMSSEMWEFDNYGDLYFEKAVCGFLVDLFSQWQEKKCNHDVNITLFSRTFYEANSIEEFPMHMRECVHKDHLGRFYEDFYRVVVQNERYDDWRPTIIQLKRLFIEYPRRVLRYHERRGTHVPRASNSTAAQGNFLEVLNMALNVFEKYHLDRSFDRTGKLSIVITPGVGVFEVDRELTYITKQRTIDCGNGSDLVCMGEQPLHAVPLFKFHNKCPTMRLDVGDDYNIPHWINYSFYTSRTQAEHMRSGKFVPRIKMPHPMPTSGKAEKLMFSSRVHAEQPMYLSSDDNNFPFVDYDAYDAQVFKLPSASSERTNKSNIHCTRSSDAVMQHKVPRIRYSSDMYDLIADRQMGSSANKSHAINISRRRSDSEEYMSNSFGGQSQSSSVTAEEPFPMRAVVGSAGSVLDPINELSPLTRPRPHRALINPFVPSRLHFKVTSNRRRWSHAFPTDLKGASMQPHHQHNSSGAIAEDIYDQQATPTREVIQAAQIVVESKIRKQRSSRSESSDIVLEHRAKTITISSNESGSLESLKEPSLSALSNPSTASLLHVDSSSSITSVINANEFPPAPWLRSVSVGMSPSLMAARDHEEFAREGHNWLWGITGEQEWTPEIKTGMDWKSMTTPASLPITTDYFPEKRSLQIDYVLAEYKLLPEDVNSWNSPVRPPLSTVQVYNEMIAQRVAQGFQMVLLPKKSTPSEVTNVNASPFQHSAFRKRHRTGAPTEEVILSIGRIFHKLALAGNTITVTRYWPRHPYPPKSTHYTYRFQVPDSNSYDVSWTNFCTEKLESYNWNYVDHYICSRGEEDFCLLESLKYWRARFFLLPSNNPATRRICDSQRSIRCDIYEERDLTEQRQLIDGFIRFIEIMNKVRRLTATRKSKSTVPIRRNATSLEKGLELRPVEVKVKARSKVNEGTDSPPPGMISPVPAAVQEARKTVLSIGDSAGGPSSPAVGSLPSSKSGQGAEGIIADLNISSPLKDVIEAMLDPSEGLPFIQKTPGLAELPPYTFASAEASMWLLANVEGVDNHTVANSILKSMLSEGLICHASQNESHPLVHGFYLYFIVTPRAAEDEVPESGYRRRFLGDGSFQYEWCEVAVQECVDASANPVTFLLPTLPRPEEPETPSEGTTVWTADCGWMAKSNQIFSAGSEGSRKSGTPELTLDLSRISNHRAAWPSYKVVNVDVDYNQKSDRSEWATARYHAFYSPSSAFQLEVQWLVATGSILGDLVATWGRKAGQSGFHLVPVPGDPFALPFNANSDPLRGPIFVPLAITSLVEKGQDLFQDFDPLSREERLLLFQDSILKRFGFILDKPPSVAYPDESRPQYVHCTGGMFVLIPDNKTTSPRNLDGTHCKPVVGSYKDYIVWQRSDTDASREPASEEENSQRTGFLWAWNFMLNKRWRTNITGDERFQDCMLADFRAFCANHDNRLKDYWDSCWASLMQPEVETQVLLEDL